MDIFMGIGWPNSCGGKKEKGMRNPLFDLWILNLR
jgi:hypothetical protein